MRLISETLASLVGRTAGEARTTVDFALPTEPLVSDSGGTGRWPWVRSRRLQHMNFRLVWMGPDDDLPAASQLLSGAIGGSLKSLAPYAERGTELVCQKRLASGRVRITNLANFRARIVRDILLDDGELHHREFEIEVELGEVKLAVSVTADEFNRMSWVLKKLGPKAIIYPGQQQHTRAAIQFLSVNIQRERLFTHLGWRK